MNILWDFDGTLFDTYPAYTRILSQVLGETVDKREIYEKLKVSYSHAIEFYKISSEQEDEIKRLRKIIPPEEMKPFTGVEEILKFAEQNVMVTHKSREGVIAILKHYGWEKYFVEMVTIDDGFPRKPDPAAYKYLDDKYKVNLAIGDRELDLLPAKEIGIATCAFQKQVEIADYHLEDYEDFFTKVLPFVNQ